MQEESEGTGKMGAIKPMLAQRLAVAAVSWEASSLSPSLEGIDTAQGWF